MEVSALSPPRRNTILRTVSIRYSSFLVRGDFRRQCSGQRFSEFPVICERLNHTPTRVPCYAVTDQASEESFRKGCGEPFINLSSTGAFVRRVFVSSAALAQIRINKIGGCCMPSNQQVGSSNLSGRTIEVIESIKFCRYLTGRGLGRLHELLHELFLSPPPPGAVVAAGPRKQPSSRQPVRYRARR